ncbi:carbamoyltransferase family protein [Baia soyae]|uniref:Carbamoyltransferase n=1 Tax=Baia soyae TaxID=1544746 RepID=A0A4R2RQQ0_9BACL|nr:carbamoyltransferase C-terminal domain-containing protein [Baia soyae]TCP66512.1 carbamoyltransferase [Baia soyae]
MYILGVNGWIRGIHDASAALFYNGKLIAAAEEERFSRRKHAFNSLPYAAMNYCLQEAGITADDIDHIAVGWDLAELDQYYGKEGMKQKEMLDIVFPQQMFPRVKDPDFHLIPHHVSHASAAFYESGFDQATIVVVDGSGENESISIARGDRSSKSVEILKTYPLRSSLGIFYEAVTLFCGLGKFGEGKTMGLASYAEPVHKFPTILEGPPQLTDDQNRDDVVLKSWLTYLQSHFQSQTKVPGYDFDPLYGTLQKHDHSLSYASIAASAQQSLEDGLVQIVKEAIQLTGMNQVCLTGGVALNCVANRKVANLPEVNGLYIQPASSDSGVSIGAAAWLSAQCGLDVTVPLDHVYSGPSFSEEQIMDVLNQFSLSYQKPNHLEEEVAKLLMDDKVVARFDGRMEMGPRALGNRSILSNPRSKEMLKRVNHIKLREQWRPLAPSMTVELKGQVLVEQEASPHMLLSSEVRSEQRDHVPAIVHVDYSTRAQVVDKRMNEGYWNLLTTFADMSGVPTVMNTSFNIGSEPIVCTPVHALKSFYASGIDALILGPILVRK